MINKAYCHDTAAVLVTYNPDIKTLRATIRAVLNQVADIFIVDNASANFSPDWIDEFNTQTQTILHLLPQQENVGIATAHNIGIKSAIAQNAKFVLLLDQDSQVGEEMVVKLHNAYHTLTEKGLQVATIGPQYHDADNGTLSQFVKIERGRFVFTECVDNTSIVDADFLVSSGSLIPVTALELVGLMDESLFIDLVDTEWCLRAKAKGLQVFGLCGAVMTHSLGEQRREVCWLFHKRIVPFHKPFRYYYMFRNSVLLYKRVYIPWGWKIADMSRCFKTAVFFGWMAEDRLQRLKMMCLGVIDGLKDRSGKLTGL